MMSEEDLFELLLDTPVEGRTALLDKHCADQPELRRRIERLLQAHQQSNMLDAPIAPTELNLAVQDLKSSERSTDRTIDLRSDREGQSFGPYTLERLLGEGGMGAVWVAKQSQPVKRRVALKLIKTGMDSRDVLSRFEHERQALAVMDHPNIARVLDAGITNDGRPFFAMELVNGLSLSKFCDEAKLATDERLDIFIQICSAVQHAHQKGIIHRDLKPANILVTMIDGKAVPKVIDFGVSKALSGSFSEHTLTTQFGAVIGTIEYMAPEQAGYSGTDIDTRADIYALGVILYELLTGLKPFDSQRIRKAALDEMLRIIREEEPSKPSTRLSSSESRPSLAAARGLDPSRLAKKIRGDLDWIALKCLEKDRNRRYETANQLALEIKRYLADEPILAGPPTAGYQLKKFLRRNRRQVAVVGMVFVALLLGLAASLWQMNRAIAAEGVAKVAEGVAKKARDDETKQRKRADELRIEAENNAARAMEGSRQAREALDVVSDDVVRSLFSKATKLTDNERQFFRRLLGLYDGLWKFEGDDRDSTNRRMQGYWRVAEMQMRLGAFDDAAEAMDRMQQAFAALNDQDDPWIGLSRVLALRSAANMCFSAGRKEEGERFLTLGEKSIEVQLTRRPKDVELKGVELLLAYDRLRNFASGDPAARAKGFGSIADQAEMLLPNSNDKNGLVTLILGSLSFQHEELALLQANEAALVPLDRMSGWLERSQAESWDLPFEHTVSTRGRLCSLRGATLAQMGRDAEAIEAYLQGLAVVRERESAGLIRFAGWDILWERSRNLRCGLADVYERQSQLREAADERRRALVDIDRWSELVVDQKPLIQSRAWIHDALARVLQKGGGSREEAVTALLNCAEYRQTNLDQFDDQKAYRDSIASYRSAAANILAEVGRSREAVEQRRIAITIREQLASELPEGALALAARSAVAWQHQELAHALFALGEVGPGVSEYEAALTRFTHIMASDLVDDESAKIKLAAHSQLAKAQQLLGDEWMNLGRSDLAVQHFSMASDYCRKVVADAPDEYGAWETLGWSLLNRGKCLSQGRDFDAVAADIGKAADAFLGMKHDDPRRPKFVEDAAHELDVAAERQRTAGEAAVAMPAFRDVLRIRNALATDYPDTPSHHQHLVWSRHNICLALANLERSDEAALESAAIQQPVAHLIADPSADRAILFNVGETLTKIAVHLRNVGQPKAALQICQTNLALRQRMVERFPDDAKLLDGIGWAHSNIGVAHLVLHDTEDAKASFRLAIDAMAERIARDPENKDAAFQYNRVVGSVCEAFDVANMPRVVADFSDAYQDRDPTKSGKEFAINPTIISRGAIAHLTLKEFPEAERDFRRCLAIREKVAPNEWQTWNTRSFLGDALLSQGKVDEAAPYLLAGYEGLLARRGAITEGFKYRFPDAVARLVRLAEAQNKPQEVAKWKAELARLEGEKGVNQGEAKP
jgi:serine/threonine protein kinase